MGLNRLGDLARAGLFRAKVVEFGKFIDPDHRQAGGFGLDVPRTKLRVPPERSAAEARF
jgi:hypothetical protein